MRSEKNETKEHNEVLKEIDEQVHRIKAIEAESAPIVSPPESKWRKFIRLVTQKKKR
jgi:hypothetical protein